MKSTATADSVPHFCQSSHLHSEHSPTISQSDNQFSNLQTNCVVIISSTLSTDSTEIIPIENSNHKEMMFKEQPMIRVFFNESRVSENSFTRVCDEQTDQRDLLNIEDVFQHLTEIS